MIEKLSETELNAAGDKLAEILGLKKARQQNSQQRTLWQTTIGTKTGVGLLRTLDSLIKDIEAGDLSRLEPEGTSE